MDSKPNFTQIIAAATLGLLLVALMIMYFFSPESERGTIRTALISAFSLVLGFLFHAAITQSNNEASKATIQASADTTNSLITALKESSPSQPQAEEIKK